MRPCLLLVAAFLAAWCPSNQVQAQGSDLIPETLANRHGLTRSWFGQVTVDQSRGRLTHLVLHDGVLYVQTDQAVVHAFDAETGATLWSKRVGRAGHPSMPVAANRDLLAVINGARLYLVNRFNGDLLWERPIDGAPGAGAALSEQRVYVPLLTMGTIAAYRIKPQEDEKPELQREAATKTAGNAPANGTHPTAALPRASAPAATEETAAGRIRLQQDSTPPLFCRSQGRSMVQPLLLHETKEEEFVVWSTDIGYHNIAKLNRKEERVLEMLFRLKTSPPIDARPSYLPADPKVLGDSGTVFIATYDGFIYAIRERDGETLWRFSTGEPIVNAPVVIEERLYAATQFGEFYCLDIKADDKKREVWRTTNLFHFVAAGKSRIYVADRYGRIQAIDAANGNRLDTIPTETIPVKLCNTQTDRIYLADREGLVQCLHELEQVEPLRHGQQRLRPPETKPAEKEKEPAQTP